MLSWVLQTVAHMFFIDSRRDLSGISKEVEISVDIAWCISPYRTTSKRFVIEIIAGFVESVA